MKVKEKQEARRLRKDAGLSVKEIVDKLGVSKGSVSVWVRDIKLTAKQRDALEERVDGHRNKQAGADKLKEMSRKRCEAYRKEGFDIAKGDRVFELLCALYWGEGFKSKNVFAISNCDPSMLLLVGNWLLRNGYKKLGFRVQYYGENGLSENEIRNYWRKVLPFLKDDNMKSFRECKINRASQKKKIGYQKYGTAELYVCSTELVQKVYGGVDFIREYNSVG